MAYEWNFGDGSEKVKADITPHRFDKPGEYTVMLTVKDNSGTPNDTSTVYYKVIVKPEKE